MANKESFNVEGLWKLAVSLQAEINILKSERKEKKGKRESTNDFKIIKLDVGGCKFTTTLATLRKDAHSMYLLFIPFHFKSFPLLIFYVSKAWSNVLWKIHFEHR